MNTATITRSAGIPTGYAFAPLAGGGYRGITEELDATVMRAAEMLREEYGCDVEIRYNSDRKSGGAFLVDSQVDSLKSPTFGICAGYLPDRPEGLTDMEWWDVPNEIVWQVTRFHISTNVQGSLLCDPSTANRNGFQPYAYIDHPTLEAAMAWLRREAVWPV